MWRSRSVRWCRRYRCGLREWWCWWVLWPRSHQARERHSRQIIWTPRCARRTKCWRAWRFQCWLRYQKKWTGGYPPEGDEMSANAEVLRGSELTGSELTGSRVRESAPVEVFRETEAWNPEDFAREQIRSLVRRVFFASGGPPITQVVFSAAEPHTDVSSICDQVGQALALETSAHIAVVGREADEGERGDRRCAGRIAIKSWSRQTAANLWRVPGFGLREWGEDS